jgi:signal transduction histidine kinase
VPIVFFGVEVRRLAGQKMWPGVTGVTEILDLRATIDVALHLHPDTNTVALITSNSAFDAYWLSVIHADLLHAHNPVNQVDLVGLPADQIFEKIAVLSPQTIVVQSLSHQLHSSKLDYLGAVSAIKGFCNEFSKQHEVSIEFTDRNVSRHLSKDISLCLFRVTQEALHNAVKYSGTSDFSVQISGTADEIQLVVQDAGAGFDMEDAKKNRGLGLVSMQERVHLVSGSFSVESTLGRGTKILVAVPLVAENASLREIKAVESTSLTGMI